MTKQHEEIAPATSCHKIDPEHEDEVYDPFEDQEYERRRLEKWEQENDNLTGD